MNFPNQLTKLRKRANLTQGQLADIMNVKQYVISSWETGRSEPSLAQVCLLGDFFKIPLDYLLGKDIIIVSNKDEFYTVQKNMEMDAKEDIIYEIQKLLLPVSNSKKTEILRLVQIGIDLINNK